MQSAAVMTQGKELAFCLCKLQALLY